MQNFLYKGELFPLTEIKSSINKLNKTISSDLTKNRKVSYNTIIDALDTLSSKLEGELSNYLKKELLIAKIKKDLNDFPGEILNTNPIDNNFQAYLPLGVVGHIIYSDNKASAITAFIDSLICGNVGILAVSDRNGQVILNILDKLIKIEPSLANYIYIFPLDSLEKDSLKSLISNCNAIVVHGDESQVIDIKTITPVAVKTIVFKNKINLSYVTKKGENKDTYEALAKDYFGTTNGYYNAKIVYYECDTKRELLTFSEKVANALKKLETKITPTSLSGKFLSSLPIIDIAKKNKTIIEIPNKTYKIIADTDQTLNIIRDYNTLIIKAVKRKDLPKLLTPYSVYLKTVALDSKIDELYELTHTLLASGVVRITDCGEIFKNYSFSSLTNFVKKISIKNSKLPKGIYYFDELKTPKPDDFNLLTSEATDKIEDLPEVKNLTKNAFLLTALGLDPSIDKIASILPNQHYLDNYISNYELLKILNTSSINVNENEDYNYVLEEIFKNDGNTIIGNSSYIFKLLSSNKDWVRSYNKLRKIFYTGDEYTFDQIKTLKEELNIEIVKPISPLGISCEESDNSTFHVDFPNEYLEILKFDSDTPVSQNEVGRLVWSIKDSTGEKITKFENGQLGRWLKGNCKCGRTSPRYEIVGKKGDLFKAAGKYINYNDIKNLFNEKINYKGLVQLNIEKVDDKETITTLVEWCCNVEDAYKALYDFYPQYKEIVTKDLGTFLVMNMYESEFAYDENTNKVINVIDDRF